MFDFHAADVGLGGLGGETEEKWCIGIEIEASHNTSLVRQAVRQASREAGREAGREAVGRLGGRISTPFIYMGTKKRPNGTALYCLSNRKSVERRRRRRGRPCRRREGTKRIVAKIENERTNSAHEQRHAAAHWTAKYSCHNSERFSNFCRRGFCCWRQTAACK